MMPIKRTIKRLEVIEILRMKGHVWWLIRTSSASKQPPAGDRLQFCGVHRRRRRLGRSRMNRLLRHLNSAIVTPSPPSFRSPARKRTT